MFHPSQTRRLNEVGETVSEVGRHHNMAETFGPLCSHGRLDVLDAGTNTQTHSRVTAAPKINTAPHNCKRLSKSLLLLTRRGRCSPAAQLLIAGL